LSAELAEWTDPVEKRAALSPQKKSGLNRVDPGFLDVIAAEHLETNKAHSNRTKRAFTLSAAWLSEQPMRIATPSRHGQTDADTRPARKRPVQEDFRKRPESRQSGSHFNPQHSALLLPGRITKFVGRAVESTYFVRVRKGELGSGGSGGAEA